VLKIPEHRTAKNLIQRMSPKKKGSHDAKISAATSDRPEQVRILVFACRHEASVSKYKVGLQKIVQC
jgi:predicted RNA-binding protein with PIN domain